MTATPDPPRRARARLLVLGIALAVALVAGWMRVRASTLLVIADEGREACTDPDGLYQMRRLERALEEGLPVAAEDPFLDFPKGSAIPWPQYYTYFLWALAAPFAPGEPTARHAFVEAFVARVPLALGILAALGVALAAGRLAGPRAALLAGLLQATSPVAVNYSCLGNGDHHALVTLLLAALLAVASAALRRDVLDSPRRSLAHGCVAGALVGALLGVWVGAFLYAVLMELVLAWLLFENGRTQLRGLTALGLSLHLVGAAVLAPAVLASPWKEEQPWMVVNLSWFHLAHLLLGAAVFLPPALRSESARARRVLPWAVGGVLVALASVALALRIGPLAAVDEGLGWMSRENRFMATVKESQPMFASGTLLDMGHFLGWLALLAPLVALAALGRALRARRLELVPWALALPFLGLQAVLQLRFAEPLTPALYVLLAWGLIEGGRRLVPAGLRARRGAALAGWALLPGLALANVGPPASSAALELGEESGVGLRVRDARWTGVRLALEWMRAHTPPPGDYGVLAPWGMGHAIEWVAGRPTLATNFGSFVGRTGFEDALAFLVADDLTRAEELLRRHRARYVLLASTWPEKSKALVSTLLPARFGGLFHGQGGVIQPRPAWFDTPGARLLCGGRRVGPGARGDEPLPDYLRLVYASPIADPAPSFKVGRGDPPTAWIWEHVAGARLVAQAEPGDELTVRIPVHYEAAHHELLFEARARAGADGTAQLRVPYATQDTNGDGQVAGARWTLGAASGALELREADVLEGREVRVP